MHHTVESLFPHRDTAADGAVHALTHQDMVVALSALLKEQGIAVLHMLYPKTDARTHHSLESLVNKLSGRGLHDVAALVAQESHYLVFREPTQAWHALQEIRLDSLAIGAHLYFQGLVGQEAEAELERAAHNNPREHIASAQ